jgi:hypothetical protein
MQLSELGTRKIANRERMREIEGELFSLSTRSIELDFEDGHRFKQLNGERTHLLRELLLDSNVR